MLDRPQPVDIDDTFCAFKLKSGGTLMEPKESSCHKPEEHHLHLCALAKTLKKAELTAYTKNPQYVCANCRGKTNRGKNLCIPKRIRS
jgi:hypothetical protein